MSKLKDWYQEYLQSSHWQNMRKRAFERYGRECSVLGCKIKKLNVHHLSYEFVGEEKEINDLRPLCWWHHWLCHRRIWGWRKVPLNRKHLTQRFLEVKRFTWRYIRPTGIFKL